MNERKLNEKWIFTENESIEWIEELLHGKNNIDKHWIINE